MARNIFLPDPAIEVEDRLTFAWSGIMQLVPELGQSFCDYILDQVRTAAFAVRVRGGSSQLHGHRPPGPAARDEGLACQPASSLDQQQALTVDHSGMM
jgi:hypothetical protein